MANGTSYADIMAQSLGPFWTTYKTLADTYYNEAVKLFPKTKDLDSLFWAYEFNKNPESVIIAVQGQAAQNPPSYLQAVSKNITNAMSAQQLTAALLKLSTNNLIWTAGMLFPDYNEFAHGVYIQRDLPKFLTAAMTYYDNVKQTDPAGAENYAKIIKGFLKTYAPANWQDTQSAETSKRLLDTLYSADVKDAVKAEEKKIVDLAEAAKNKIMLVVIAAIGIGGLIFLTRGKK